MTPTSILLAARALIADPQNWRKGLPGPTNEGYCCADALYAACGFESGRKITDADWKVLDEARALFRKAAGTDCTVSFNDDPNTSHAMVLDALDRAVKAAA